MRRTLLLLTIGVLVVLRAPLTADELVYARFSDYLESLRVQAGIPGLSAAVVGPKGIEWERAFGLQDIERLVPMRTDTPVHIDGLTEALSATLVLQCVEEQRLSLDDRIGRYRSEAPDPLLTLRQILTHTNGSANPSYSYRPDRLAPLTAAIRACTGDSFRETLANLFDRLAMTDSVPGPDVLTLAPPAEGVLTSEVDRYKRVLARLAVPYTVDSERRASPTRYAAETLTPTSGVVSTVLDLAQFDLALKSSLLVKPETLAISWRPPTTAAGDRLPHAIGWFSQTYEGEAVLWQYGSNEGSSSLVMIVPARSLTLILLGNSNGLARSFDLASGDVRTSPFGRLFLGLFIR
jgi:CubicO group peptidase (beta-lactamase class C family)